jgi:predicted nucleotidyltransferase
LRKERIDEEVVMKLPENLKNEIVARIQPLDPEMVVLFGSYAAGEPNEDSDIDLYIVTKDDRIPHTWREKSNLRLAYSQRLLDFRIKYPVDLIVHTKPMHERFMEIKSSFSRDIMNKGVRLL